MPSKTKKSKKTPKSKEVKKGFVRTLEQNFSPVSRKGKRNLALLSAAALAGKSAITGKEYYDFVYSTPRKYLNESDKAKYEEFLKNTNLTTLKINYVKLKFVGGLSLADLCGVKKGDKCSELIPLLVKAQHNKNEAESGSGILQTIKSWFSFK
jgi:hypothetical protein